MRIESSVTSVSWIPKGATEGFNRLTFGLLRVAHFDPPPPDDGSPEKPPGPGATVEAVPAFGTRPTVPGRRPPRHASSAQARGCACS